jgi:GNAT superfamily N-acetyltransferase
MSMENTSLSLVGLTDMEIRSEPLSELHRHVMVPSAFESTTVFDVEQTLSGLNLLERRLPAPFRKNYDLLEDPLNWPARFDLSKWILVGVHAGNERLGGAIGALEADRVVLWDLRVSAESHRKGIGSTLFRTIESWGRDRGCRELTVETQNVNVAACRFYERQGCVLEQANPGAYPQLPEEIQLIFNKALIKL